MSPVYFIKMVILSSFFFSYHLHFLFIMSCHLLSIIHHCLLHVILSLCHSSHLCPLSCILSLSIFCIFILHFSFFIYKMVIHCHLMSLVNGILFCNSGLVIFMSYVIQSHMSFEIHIVQFCQFFHFINFFFPLIFFKCHYSVIYYFNNWSWIVISYIKGHSVFIQFPFSS